MRNTEQETNYNDPITGYGIFVENMPDAAE